MFADLVFAVGTLVLSFPLWLALRDSKNRWGRRMSVTYAAVFASFVVAQVLVHLYVAMVPTSVTALTWAYVAWRRAELPVVAATHSAL